MTRKVSGFLICLLAVVPLIVGATKAVATPAQSSNPSFSQIAGCISGADNLLVSVVVDESASLRSTDPQALRVQGISTAVDSIAQLAESTPSLNVEMSLSTFARGYAHLAAWKRLTPSYASSLRTLAARELPRRDSGDATDYRQALLGAQQDLNARQKQLNDPNACKLLLWFTDGALDVDADTSNAAAELCQTGGILDSVRSDGIAVVALALFTPGASVTDAQRNQLRAVAEGSAPGVRCGMVPIPADHSTGVYLPANDPSALERLFAGAGALIAGGRSIGTVHCPSPQCPKGRYQFYVDPGIAGLRAVVQNQDAVQRIFVTAPSGEATSLGTGASYQFGDASATLLNRGDLSTFDLRFNPISRSRGLWSMQVPAKSAMDVYWFWGAQLQVVTQDVTAGSSNRIDVELRDQDGDALDAGLYRNVVGNLRVAGHDLPLRVTPAGQLTASLPMGIDSVDSTVALTATLAVRTKPGGIQLGPISTVSRLPVLLPPAFPTMTPESLDFGSIEGTGSRTATVQVTGSQLGSTRACIEGAEVALPGNTASATVTAEPSCVSLNALETRKILLTMATSTSADGVASGTVHFTLRGAAGAGNVDLALPAELHMTRQVNEATRWELVAALLLLALLVPLTLLVGSNLMLGRFILASTSTVATVPVRISRLGLTRLGNNPRLVTAEDFQNLGFSGLRKSSHMRIDGTSIHLRAKRIFSLREPVGVAQSDSGRMVVSSISPHIPADGATPAALGAIDASFVTIESLNAENSEADGTLVIVLPTDVDAVGLHERLEALISRPQWDTALTMAASRTHPVANGEPLVATVDSPSPDPDTSLPGSSRLPGWDDDSAPPATGPTAKSARGKRAHSTSDSSRPTTSNPPDESDLPPLPDFLKD